MEITVFGGAGEIGGNQIRLRSRGEERWLDLGLPYGRYGQYFEEYLQPRTAPILADLLRTGLIPPVDLYRYDLRSLAAQRIGPLDLAPCAEASRVHISHPHLDHAGLLGLLRPNIEVALSAEAVAVLRSLQETSGSGFPMSDLLWVGDRNEAGQKIRGAATPRSLLVAGAAGPLLAFHGAVRSFNAGRRSKVELPDLDLRPTVDESFAVDHSIPGAIGWALRQEGELVIYPGDVRSHGRRRGAMLQALEQMRARAQGRVLLVLEGTRFGETDLGESEESIQQALTEVVRRAEGKLALLDFHARNVERLLTADQVALATGRQLVITHKDAHLLLSLKDVAAPYEGCPPIETVCQRALIYRKARVSNQRPWEAFVEEHFQVIDFSAVRQHPERYLLCFSFFDIAELIDIVDGKGGGIYVYSSSEAFNEEMRLDLARLRNWLALLGLEFVGDPDAPSPQYGRLHVSGHGGSEELAALATALRPDTVLVVHTEKPQEYAAFLRERLGSAQVIVPRCGESFIL